MTANQVLILTLLIPTLLACEQAMRSSTWPTWLSVPAWLRGILVVVAGAAAGALDSVVQTGVPLVQALATGAAMAIPAIIKIVFHVEDMAKATKAAIVALFLGSAALQTGCVGTLEETRAQIKVTSVAGVKTATDQPRPPVCLKLSQQRTAALVGARVGEVGMASTAAVGIVVDSVEPKSDHGKQVQHDWTLGLAIASGVFAVGGAAGEVAGKLLTDEWIAQRCAQ